MTKSLQITADVIRAHRVQVLEGDTSPGQSCAAAIACEIHDALQRMGTGDDAREFIGRCDPRQDSKHVGG